MKHLIFFLLLLPLTVSAQSSQLTLTIVEAFHNTKWEWTDRSDTFQVEIVDCEALRNQQPEGSCMYVRYKLINSNGEVIYTTRETPASNSNTPIGGIIAAYNESPPKLYGQIEDRTHPDHVYGINAMLKIEYIPCQGLGCSPQISWKITKPKEINLSTKLIKRLKY